MAEMLTVILDRGENPRRHTRGGYDGYGLDVTPGDGTYDLCNYEFS